MVRWRAAPLPPPRHSPRPRGGSGGADAAAGRRCGTVATLASSPPAAASTRPPPAGRGRRRGCRAAARCRPQAAAPTLPPPAGRGRRRSCRAARRRGAAPMPPPRHCPRPRGREQTTDKAPAVTGIHVCESGVIACESGVIASAVRRRRGSWRLHRCRPAREGLGGTALAIREGPRPRQCSARLRRQLHHTGPRRLRLYARKGRGGAALARVSRLLLLRRRRSSQLDCCSSARKGFAGRRPLGPTARGPVARQLGAAPAARRAAVEGCTNVVAVCCRGRNESIGFTAVVMRVKALAARHRGGRRGGTAPMRPARRPAAVSTCL